MIAIEEGLRKRRVGGEIVRLEISNNMPLSVIDLLTKGLSVEQQDLYHVESLLGLDDLFEIANLTFHHLKYPKHFSFMNL